MADARTVLVLVADDARHLPEVVDSILRQTDRDFSLVVAGAAPDGLPDDARLRTAPQQADGLAGDAELVARLDGRVVLHPEWLASLRAALEAAPEAGGAFARTLLFSESGADLGAPPVDEPQHALRRAGRDGEPVRVSRLLCHRRLPTQAPPRPSLRDKVVHRVRRIVR